MEEKKKWKVLRKKIEKASLVKGENIRVDQVLHFRNITLVGKFMRRYFSMKTLNG